MAWNADVEHSNGIMPAPACDLLDRLTTTLGIGFSLTDRHGATIASTAGQPAGTLDLTAASILEGGHPLYIDAAAGAIYVPVHMNGKLVGALVAYGAGEDVRSAAQIAAVAIGLALDFAEAAASLSAETVNAGWLLYRLLRGSRHEAEKARSVAAIYGWNLFVQRVAIVVVAGASEDRRGLRAQQSHDVLAAALGDERRGTPFGQVDDRRWVALPRYEPTQSWSVVVDIANRIAERFAAHDLAVHVGIGEPHLPVQPVKALRLSYREALYAVRIGRQLASAEAIHQLRALGAAAFFSPSMPSRRRLARLVLSPLQQQPVVLQTLSAYLSSDMSVARAADVLGIHRHTVRNHLERVRELTGMDPRSLEGAVQLKLALLALPSDA